ncbi:MAG: proton-translocating transhydrogenase family protein, partial [Sphingomonas sp.]
GALIAAAATGMGEGGAVSNWLGLLAVVLARVNIVGGFAVTARRLAMDKKKAK